MSERHQTNDQQPWSPPDLCSSAFLADWMQAKSVIDSIMNEPAKDRLLLCYAFPSLLIDMQGMGNCDPMMNETCGKDVVEAFNLVVTCW